MYVCMGANFYCGLNSNWTAGADFVVATLADLPAIVGVFLGDEPEIGGVPYTEMCELSLYLKRALQKVGWQDIFLGRPCGAGRCAARMGTQTAHAHLHGIECVERLTLYSLLAEASARC